MANSTLVTFERSGILVPRKISVLKMRGTIYNKITIAISLDIDDRRPISLGFFREAQVGGLVQ